MRVAVRCAALAAVVPALMTSGVGVTDIVGGSIKPLPNCVHVCTFTNSGSFVVSEAGTMDILVVGGGGAGQACGGGGGGAVVYTQSVDVAVGPYTVVIGEGGLKTDKTGGTSSIVELSLSAPGGGRGGGPNGAGGAGANGGGGGASNVAKWPSGYTGGAATWAFGHVGGASYNASAVNQKGGGGGGAGQDGYAGNDAEHPGRGGDGLPCPISGALVYYGGGGGGGGAASTARGEGGNGGGGKGGSKTAGIEGEVGQPNTGGGGGGGGYRTDTGATSGGAGGSGVVILRYKSSAATIREPLVGGEVTKVKVAGERSYVNAFTNNGTLVVAQPTLVDVLLVGGGGGGGFGGGGGGGGGAVALVTNLVLTAGSYDVVVGAGGLGLTGLGHATENDGGTTSFLDYRVPGGGAGGYVNMGEGYKGANGGGGGTSNYVKEFIPRGGTNTWEFGHVGGNGYSTSSTARYGGGGGGAGAPGHAGNEAAETRCRGGEGLPCDFYGPVRYYGAGGGGGTSVYRTHYAGGDGGGAGGCMTNGGTGAYEKALPGVDGRGGGGGGGAAYGNYNYAGANGGCGCVLIRYKALGPGLMLIFR